MAKPLFSTNHLVSIAALIELQQPATPTENPTPNNKNICHIWFARDVRSKHIPKRKMLAVGTMPFPKWSLSLPASGCPIAKTTKLSIDTEVTKVLLAENSCSQGETYAPNAVRIP